MIRLVAIVAYWLGIDGLFYWLNRHAKRIITFHNVLPDHLFRNDLPNGVSNSASSFEAIVDEIGTRYRFSVDFFDAKTCTLTFDDGYLNQYEIAGSILRAKGIPAALFVCGDLIGSQEPLKIDQLLHWTQVEYGEFALSMWISDIWPRFLAQEKIDFDYDAISKSYSPEYRRLRLTGVTSEQLKSLRMSGWTIGWHTYSHRPLASLDGKQLSHELDSPSEFRNECVSYPYGNQKEVGAEAIDEVCRAGYPCAVSNTNAEENNSSRYFMPRMFLPSDKYLLHFVLSGCKYFLKYRRLLPVVR